MKNFLNKLFIKLTKKRIFFLERRLSNLKKMEFNIKESFNQKEFELNDEKNRIENINNLLEKIEREL